MLLFYSFNFSSSPTKKKPYRAPPQSSISSIAAPPHTRRSVFASRPSPLKCVRHSASSDIRQNVSVPPKTRTTAKITTKIRGFRCAVWRLIVRVPPPNKGPDLGPRSIHNGQPNFAFNRLRRFEITFARVQSLSAQLRVANIETMPT